MDRLTYKHDDKWCISGLNGKLISDKHANYWGEAVDRLAAYENAGIEPCDYAVVRASYEEAERAKKDLSSVMDILGEHIELIKANNDGRVVVLPCKIGDTVDGKIGNWFGTVEEISINNDGIFLYVASGGYNHLVKPDEVKFR